MVDSQISLSSLLSLHASGLEQQHRSQRDYKGFIKDWVKRTQKEKNKEAKELQEKALRGHLFEMQKHLHSQQKSLHSLSAQLAEFEKYLIKKSVDHLSGASANL